LKTLRSSLVALGVSASMAVGIGAAGVAQAAEYDITVTNITNGIYFTPVIAAAHDPAARMFELGGTSSAELQAIAEGGDVSSMSALLDSIGASVATGDGLVAPNGVVNLTLSGATPGSVFSLTTMLLPTNDGFVGIDSATLPRAPGESVTLLALGYDAGTEANDELVGGGAPGVPGFPAPPPVVASGTGTGGTGVQTSAEGFIHIHRGVLGDLDSTGGVSDINSAEHRWLNAVAQVVITRTDDGGTGGDTTVSSVGSLTSAVYSRSAAEIFWDPATSQDSTVVTYRVLRDGAPVANMDSLSFFEEGLEAGTTFEYSVIPVDGNGVEGPATSVQLTTNSQ